MEKSQLKIGSVHQTDYVDTSTGDIVGSEVNFTTYLADTKEQFYLMYSSMVLVLKQSSDVKMKLFASLMERYGKGQEFSMSKSLKELIAEECNCSPRSFDTAFTYLIKHNLIVNINTRLYQINPRHVFQGSSTDRNKALKAIIELGCKDC
jgi:hypothetical protein